MKTQLFFTLLALSLLLLSACGGSTGSTTILENTAWEEARKENSLNALDSFLIQFPETNRKKEIAKLRDGMLWQTALLSNTVYYYKLYLSEFPQGRYKEDAEKKLEELPADDIGLATLTAKTFVGTIHQGDTDYDVLALRFTEIEENNDQISFKAAVHLSSDIRKQLTGTIVKPNYIISFVEDSSDEFLLDLCNGRAYLRNGELLVESIDLKQYWYLK